MELALCLRDVPARDVGDEARAAEQHGFVEVWLPDGAHGAQETADGRLTGRDAMCSLAAMFSATTSMRGAIGVAAVPLHHEKALALQAATLAELSGGRFTLGIGVSHPELTGRQDVPFPDRPVTFMRHWTRALRQLSSDGRLDFGSGWDVMVAALGPRMVAMGAEEADGIVLNWLSPAAATSTVASIRERAGGRRVRTVLYLRAMPREAARRDAAAYDGLDNYHRHFVAQGLTDVDAIVDATTVPTEDGPAARDRLEQYAAAGIDTVCIYPAGLSADQRRKCVTQFSQELPNEPNR